MISIRYAIVPKPILRMLYVVLFIMLAGSFSFVGFVQGDEEQDLNSQIQITQEQIKDKEAELRKTEADVNAIRSQSGSISYKMRLTQEKLTEAEENSKATAKQMKEISDELDVLQEELDTKQNVMRSLLVQMYKDQDISWMEILLSGQSVDSMWRVLAYRQKHSDRLEREVQDEMLLVNDLEAKRDDLRYYQDLVEKEAQMYRDLYNELQSEQVRIAQEYAARMAKQRQLQADVEGLNSKLGGLNRQLQEIIRRKANESSSGPSNNGGGDTSGGGNTQPPAADTGKYNIYINGVLKGEGVSGPIRVSANSGILALNHPYGSVSCDYSHHCYRGVLEFRSNSNVYAINELPMQSYLAGIGEVPSSWNMEALKTQVLAARTYAIKNYTKRQNYYYGLRDDTYDQNYVGYYKEIASDGARWVSAVQATDKQVIKNGGEIINAYYHSTCGGHTLSSAEVWGGNRAYAQAKSDWYQSEGGLKSYDAVSPWSYKKWGSATINDDQMVDLINATLYLSQNVNDPQRQAAIYSPSAGGKMSAEIVSLLNGKDFATLYGDLQNVQSVYNGGTLTLRADSRLTEKVRVTGSNGTVDLDGEVFWIVYNARSPGDLTIYWSNFWTSVKEGGSWNFYTRGYPHRIGMCQYGANGRANAGQSYTQIIGHYYNGSTVSSVSGYDTMRVGITRVGGGDNTVQAVGGGTLSVSYAGGGIQGAGVVRVQKL